MFFRRLVKQTAFMGWFIAALSLTSVPQAQAAQTIFYSALGSAGCVNTTAGTSIPAQKLVAHASGTINTINVLIGNGDQTNFSTSRFVILADNPSVGSPVVGSPSTTLATFTPDSISGSAANTIAKYVGSYSFTSGTSYWLAPLQKTSVFPACFWYANDNSLLSMNSLHVDTSTSTSNTSWRRAYSNSASASSASWFTPMHDGLAWQFSLENNTATPVAASLATQSGSSTTSFRTVTPLRVSVDTASKVTYYANGKVIAGCRNVLSSAGVATCNWKPSVHGSYRVYATVNPVSNSFIASTTSVISIGVAARTNNR
jgi:hypothetical protein